MKNRLLKVVALLALSLLNSGVRAANGFPDGQEPGGAVDLLLLTHPESAFCAPPAGAANFAISVDKQPVSYAAPEILFQKSGSDADFIAGVWKDAQGQVVHQREVLIVKPDYGVVVDYLYGWKGAHEVSCVVKLPAAEVKAERGSSRFQRGNGTDFIVQHLGLVASQADPAVSGSAGFSEVSDFYRLALPAPYASVIYTTRSGVTKVEYVQPSNPMVVKCKVTLSDGRIDEVGIAWEYRDQLHLGGKVLKGWAAVARKGPGVTTDIQIKPPRLETPTP